MDTYKPYVPVSRLKPLILEYLSRGGQMGHLAELTGINVRTLSAMKNGGRGTVRFDTADRLLTHLGLVDVWHTDLKDIYKDA